MGMVTSETKYTTEISHHTLDLPYCYSPSCWLFKNTWVTHSGWFSTQDPGVVLVMWDDTLYTSYPDGHME